MAAKRRGRGEGTIFQRKDGLWCGAISLGFPLEEKYQRRYVYGKSKQEALAKVIALRAEDPRNAASDSRTTIGSFLERWLNGTVKSSVRPSTFKSYSGITRRYLIPEIGGIPMTKLAPQHLHAMIERLEAKNVPPRTRQYTYAVLHAALQHGMRMGMLNRNVSDAVPRPRIGRKSMSVLDAAQVEAFLAAARADKLHTLYVLAIMTGMRFGELLALQWRDIDLKHSTLYVRHTLQDLGGKLKLQEPKSARGRRRIDLPPAAVRALQEHRQRVSTRYQRLSPWVFCDRRGGPLRQGNVTRRSFKKILKTAGLPAIRFHDLRHTAATLLLAAGVHPKVVQERLGHASVALTLDTYSHVLPSMQRDAADRLEEMLGKRVSIE